MSISIETCRNEYVGNNSTANYPFNFLVRAASQLSLIVKNTAGLETTLIYPTDFSVAGLGVVSGGSITLVAGNLATGYELTIRRVRPVTQTTSIRNETEYFQGTIEDALDDLLMIDQQQEEEISRGLAIAVSDNGAIDPTLSPVKSYQGLYVIRLNQTLDGFELVSALQAYSDAFFGGAKIVSLTNNSTGNVAGAIQDKTLCRAWRFNWTVYRETNSSKLVQSGFAYVVTDGTTWTMTDGPMSQDDGGVTFTVDSTTGQVAWATTNQSGTVVKQQLSFTVSNYVGV